MSENIIEPQKIGLGKSSKAWLIKFRDENIFKDMKDAYIFSISYALYKNITPPLVDDLDSSIYSISQIDPNNEIYSAISCLMPEYNGPIYKMAERLADFGASELAKLYQQGKLDIPLIVESVS